MLHRCASLQIAVLAIGCSPNASTAQDGPPPEIRALIDGLMQTLQDSDDESIGLYIAQNLDPAYVAEVGNESLEAMMREMRSAAVGVGGLDVGRTPNGLRIMLEGGTSVAIITLDIPFSPPNLITKLGFEVDDGAPGSNGPPGQPESLPEALETRTQAVESLWTPGQAPEAREAAFVQNHLAPSAASEGLGETIHLIRDIGAQAGGLMVEFEGNLSTFKLRGPRNADVLIHVQDRAPFLISSLEIVQVEPEELPPPPVFSWEGLGEQLQKAADDGFSGSVLAVQKGNIVLNQGFGDADDAGTPVTAETLFDIGSMPIDFTRGAVLLLAQRGQLDLEASIAEYLPEVPMDKTDITIAHLMRGESGLPNFHGLPSDADLDLAPIDRDEAIRRIMSQTLLFEPGEGQAHSHSAWTLLAALTEIVSGESYLDFLQHNYFEPAGMHQTGLYGPDARFEVADQATGYGGSRPTTPNVPLKWGPTSWLVMGSGGMVSTPGDLYRWHRFIRDSGPLTETSRQWLPSSGRSSGASDRGFMTLSAFDGDTIIIACTNRFDRQGDPSHQVLRGLGALATGDS